MTWKDLIDAITPERMPQVLWQGKYQGIVTEIKFNNKYKGITVRFDSLSYGVWFWGSEQKNRRKRYLRELDLLTTPNGEKN